MTNPLAALLGMTAKIDADVRAASPKCPQCGRPDGGVVPSGQTAWEAGLVDRALCPSRTCPMRSCDNG
jgi:hypothetical protein